MAMNIDRRRITVIQGCMAKYAHRSWQTLHYLLTVAALAIPMWCPPPFASPFMTLKASALPSPQPLVPFLHEMVLLHHLAPIELCFNFHEDLTLSHSVCAVSSF